MTTDADIDTYGKRLRSARKAAQLTQKQLGDKVGLQQATISELENDEYAGSAKTAEMAEALGVDALWLAQGTGSRFAGVGPKDAASSASLASAVIASSPAAKEAIRAILRADRAGESPETFKLVQRLFPDGDEEAKLER